VFKTIIMLLISCGLFAVQSDRPERKVEGNTITSDHDPRVKIVLPKPVAYAGADRWNLYDIADCELHAFVEAGAKNNVQRLYWVQFEGYLPAKPEMRYQYDSPQHTNIGGWDFYVDTWVRANNATTRAGSDREHVEALIRAKGYKMPAGMMYVRLVHLLDQQKRRERGPGSHRIRPRRSRPGRWRQRTLAGDRQESSRKGRTEDRARADDKTMTSTSGNSFHIKRSLNPAVA